MKTRLPALLNLSWPRFRVVGKVFLWPTVEVIIADTVVGVTGLSRPQGLQLLPSGHKTSVYRQCLFIGDFGQLFLLRMLIHPT